MMTRSPPTDKGPDLARYVADRLALRMKDVRQAIQVAKLCDSPE